MSLTSELMSRGHDFLLRKNSFQIDGGICGSEDNFKTKRTNGHERVGCCGRGSQRTCVRAYERASERASERTCVHACVCTSVCSADVKADPGLRVQAAVAPLLVLTLCKIPVAISFFVAFVHAVEQHLWESLGETRKSKLLYEGAVAEGWRNGIIASRGLGKFWLIAGFDSQRNSLELIGTQV